MGLVFSVFNCFCFIIYNLLFGMFFFEVLRICVKLLILLDYINVNWIRVRDSDIKYYLNFEIFN